MNSPIEAYLATPARQSCLILGAPGSGKTSGIIERIVRLHAHGESADNLFVLTPSRTRASLIRDEISLRLGATTAGARARSLQAFAFAIVKSFNELSGLPEPKLLKGRLIDQDIREMLAGDVLDGSGPEWPTQLGLSTNGSSVFRSELREWIARTDEYELTIDRISKLAGEREKIEWLSAANFRQKFNLITANARPYSYSSTSILKMAEKIVRSGLPETFSGLSHVGVDDAQDLTFAGLQFLDSLRSQGVGITVAADPDLASATFRGSEPQALAVLEKRWDLRPIVLSEVFRHGPEIRNAVAELTGKIGAAGAGSQRGCSSAKTSGKMLSLVASNSHSEVNNIIRIITEAVYRDGTPFGEIAVITRRSSQVRTFSKLLTAAGIPTHTNLVGASLAGEEAVREMIELVAVGRGLRPLDPQSARRILGGPYGGMSQQEIRRLRSHVLASSDNLSINKSADQLIVSALSKRDGFANLDHQVASRAAHISIVLDNLRQAKAGTPITELLWMVWEDSPLRAYWTSNFESGSSDTFASRSLDALVALFHQAEAFASEQTGLASEQFIEELLDSEIPDDILLPEPMNQAVFLSTPAGVAGREFDFVILSSLEEGVWPDLRPRESLLGARELIQAHEGIPNKVIDQQRLLLEDELRLGVLAVSRAKKNVLITATEDEESKPSSLFELLDRHSTRIHAPVFSPVNLPSVVGGLRRQLQSALEEGSEATKIAADIALLASNGVRGADPKDWWGLLEESSSIPLYPEGKIPLSPSSIKLFESSPIEWFLSTISDHNSSPAASLGSLLHSALEKEPTGDLNKIWQHVDDGFEQLGFETGWVTIRNRRLAQRMTFALSEFIKDRKSQGWSAVASEQRFEFTQGRVRISGVIDRIEQGPDGSIMVIDLKTGSSRTEREVADDPQMFSYQIAISSEDLQKKLNINGPSVGAGLLFLREGAGGNSYRLTSQPPLDQKGKKDFLERLEIVAEAMSDNRFGGSAITFGGSRTSAKHRWHFVGAVCGDV